MHAFVLSELRTIRGHQQTVGSPVVTRQGEEDMLDLARYLDLVLTLDVQNVTLGGATAIDFYLNSQPTADNSLIQLLATVTLTGPGITVVPLVQSSSDVLHTRFVRWSVTPASLPMTGAWDVTFRAFVCANPVGHGAKLPGPGDPLHERIAGPREIQSKPLHLTEAHAPRAPHHPHGRVQ